MAGGNREGQLKRQEKQSQKRVHAHVVCINRLEVEYSHHTSPLLSKEVPMQTMHQIRIS